ncbi:MAG: galactokinase [Planctomycetes bacterium]|nr:galactokinase [Planctomycetota bacterium]
MVAQAADRAWSANLTRSIAAARFSPMHIKELRRKFTDRFGRAPQFAVRAPGRVNLIGEHTDYNEGYVLPIAIERQTLAAAAGRGDRVFNFVSLQQDAPAVADLSREPAPQAGEPRWANYCKGVLAGLLKIRGDLRGADIMFSSDVPLGGGLSSSASLEVAAAWAILLANGLEGSIADRDLALICQKAEHDFAGAPCGIMDQSIAIMGKSGRALLLDCRDSQTRQIHFDRPDMVLLVADTKVKHELSDGGYAARRKQCESAAQTLGVPSLRSADNAMLAAASADGRLAKKEQMRARHVVGEIRRAVEAADALEAGDYTTFGRLMYASHESLRSDYEVSCEELDAIVELVRPLPGVCGARMTGGGFGGCAIILAASAEAQKVSKAVSEGFAKKFGHACPIFATRAADGAGKISMQPAGFF